MNKRFKLGYVFAASAIFCLPAAALDWNSIKEQAQEALQSVVKGNEKAGASSENAAESAEQDAKPSVAVSRERVREIQSLLSQLGFEPGPADGLMGRRTAEAISQYQRQHRLPADGQRCLST